MPEVTVEDVLLKLEGLFIGDAFFTSIYHNYVNWVKNAVYLYVKDIPRKVCVG